MHKKITIQIFIFNSLSSSSQQRLHDRHAPSLPGDLPTCLPSTAATTGGQCPTTRPTATTRRGWGPTRPRIQPGRASYCPTTVREPARGIPATAAGGIPTARGLPASRGPTAALSLPPAGGIPYAAEWIRTTAYVILFSIFIFFVSINPLIPCELLLPFYCFIRTKFLNLAIPFFLFILCVYAITCLFKSKIYKT